MVLDEVHRLPNPSVFLKVAADHFPRIRVLATGSSTLGASVQREPVHYWRDKAGHEVDFVLRRRGQPPFGIECKWSADGFRAGNLRAFRTRHSGGENLVVCADVDRAYVRETDGVRVTFENLPGLVRRLTSPARARRPTGRR